MKNWLKLSFNKLFFIVLILLIAINIIGYLCKDPLIIQTAMPLFIPVFLIFFFVKYKSLDVIFISFFLFSLLGDMSSMLFAEETFIQSSSILYLLSYLYLIIIAIPKFKLHQVDKIIGIYLLTVFIISLFFLYNIYILMKAINPNENEVFLFGLKNLTLIILGFIAYTVYLNTQTKQSILFLNAVMLFSLSAMLNYINIYYLYNWGFELLQRVLYAIGLYMIFNYVMIQDADKKKIKHTLRIKVRYSSENILA